MTGEGARVPSASTAGALRTPRGGGARLRRRREPQLRPQTLGQPVVHGQRRRAVAVGGVVLHEVAGRRLVERIELEPPPRVPDRERRRGRLPLRAARGRRSAWPSGGRAPRAPSPGRDRRGAARGTARRRPRGRRAARSSSSSCRSVVHRRPTRSLPATRKSAPSGPSARRSAQAALRSEARALASSTSGQKRAASAPRGCSPGCSASQASSSQARLLAGCSTERPATSASSGPRSRTRSMWRSYAGAPFMGD